MFRINNTVFHYYTRKDIGKYISYFENVYLLNRILFYFLVN